MRKATKIEGLVELSGAPLYNIIRNLVEKNSYESIGGLVGKKHNQGYILINSYPWTNASTTPTSACHGNMKALDRLIDFENTLETLSNGFKTIGHYHSHPYSKTEDRTYMHKTDKNFFMGIMDLMKIKESIQIIASIKRLEPASRKKGIEIMLPYKKKLRVIFNTKNLDMI